MYKWSFIKTAGRGEQSWFLGLILNIFLWMTNILEDNLESNNLFESFCALSKHGYSSKYLGRK